MRKLFSIAKLFVFVLVFVGAASCVTEADYTTRKVYIEMTEVRVSAGFAHFTFEADRPCYFLSGCVKNPDLDEYDLQHYEEQFKLLMIDSAYIGYLNWRHDHLRNGTHDVADFRDHSLKYTSADQYFQFLEPATEYIVFCFVVDPITDKPAGPLQAKIITTEEESAYSMVFSYRINGYWDYIYPLEEYIYAVDVPAENDPENPDAEPTNQTVIQTGYELLTDVPWAATTVDSLWLVEQGYSHPGAFFTDTFVHISNATSRDNVRVLYGIYAHNNNGVGDGTSSTNFEEGHTYYTGIAALDGPVLGSDGRPKNYAIYRFTWNGPATQLMFEPHDPADTRGAW